MDSLPLEIEITPSCIEQLATAHASAECGHHQSAPPDERRASSADKKIPSHRIPYS
jgi:hypothetical protein